MFGVNKDGKPVNVKVIAHTYIDGQLVMQGTVIEQMDAQLALELAGAGKVAPATEEDVKAFKANAKKSNQAG